MEFKGSKTEANLHTAFAGESEARNKYTYYAGIAKKEGYNQIASIFEETAGNEKEHAKIWFKILMSGGIPHASLPGHLLLAEADAGIPQADVLTVIFVGVIEIVFPLDIPALALSKEERVRQVIHIRFHSVEGDRILAAPLLPGVDGVRHPGGVGQRPH